MSTCKRMWTDREIRSMAVNSVENKSDLKVFENIVDKDGHKRFIEGDITAETISGATQVYGKWSLSGTHLMAVLILSLDNAATITSGATIADIEVPKWIADKVTPLTSNNIVSRGSNDAFASDWSTQAFNSFLVKPSASVLRIIKAADLTLTADRTVRIQFDLLIDDE